MSNYFYTIVFDRKDCYDAEHDLLAIANFLVILAFGV